MPPDLAAAPSVYAIPHLAGGIVYAPLRRLAFFADRETMNYVDRAAKLGVHRIQDEPVPPPLDRLQLLDPDPAQPKGPLADEPFQPTTCVLLLTTACNLRCIYCYAAPEGHGQELDASLGKKAIDIVCDNAKKLGRPRFEVSFHGGGEPTLAWSSLRELANYARSKSLPCTISLTSNGAWTASRRREIIELAPSNVSLSLDGIAAVQDRQRPTLAGGGSFEAVWATIREIEQRGIRYGLRASVTDRSIGELAESIEYLCRNTRAATFQVEPVFGYGRALQTSSKLLDTAAFVEAFLDAYDIAQFYGRHLYYSAARPWLVTARFCTAVDDALIVSTDGSLTPCYEVFGITHPLAAQLFFGHIDASGLTIDQATRRKLYDRIEARRRQCRSCFCYYHCAGDCIAKVLSNGEDGHLQFGPRCSINQSITKELILRNVERAGGIWREVPPRNEPNCA